MDATGVGRHAVCEFCGASHLDSVERAEDARPRWRARVTLIDVFVHRFSPHGVSGVAVIAESHLAIHAFPEASALHVDLFSCKAFDADVVRAYVRRRFAPRTMNDRLFDRSA